jgi:hypothetical protein
LVIVIVSRRAISDAVAAFMVDSPICLWVLPKAYRLRPKVCFRHREPQSGEKLKAWVTRVLRDFGPLVQNSSQAQGKHGREPFAPLLARKIRERSIRHGISHRFQENASWDSLSSPGLCMPLGKKWARDTG